MEKIKQIKTYYCDYCGKQCDSTPLYVLPSLESDYAKDSSGNKLVRFGESVHTKQKDICPGCQNEIARFLNLMKYATVKIDDVEKVVFDNFNKVVSGCKMKPTVCGSKESIDILSDLMRKFGQ